MNKQELIPLVEQECLNLRAHASYEEISRLLIEKVDGTVPSKCIYGMMCGTCYNERATELIKQCCQQCFDKFDVYHKDTEIVPIEELDGVFDRFSNSFWSPIELFIVKWVKNEDFGDYDAFSDQEAIRAVVDLIQGKTGRLIYEPAD